MKTQIVFLIVALLLFTSLKAQVKIGDNPQNLDPASVLELESNNRVLVITRVTTVQMSTINPLRGALVYNTDEECIHYYDGNEWINICEELDNSFTVSTNAVFNTAPDARDSTVVVTRTETPDGFNYNFEVNQITGDNVFNGTLFGSDLAPQTVGGREIQNGSVGLEKLEDGTLMGQLMQWDGTNWTLISEADINVTEGDGVVGNEVTDAADGTLVRTGSGDVLDPFVLDVSPEGIGNAELAPDAVTTDKILDGTINTEDLDNDIITNDKMATNAVGTLELIDDSVDRDKINANVAGTGLIQAGDGSLEVDVTQFAGDGDISSPDGTILLGGTTTGALFEDVSFDVADDAITAAKINLDVAGTGLIQAGDGSLEVDVTQFAGDGDISSPDGTILLGGTTTGALFEDVSFDVADDAITAAKINLDVAGTGLIQAGDGSLEVDVTQFAGDGDISSPDGTILLGGTTTGALFEDVSFDVADDAITNAKMADNSVNTLEIVDNAVTSAKIASNAIITAKILDANVTNAKIADNAVNVAKIGTLGVADANSVLTTDGVGDPQWENRTNFASSALSDGDIFVGDATNNATGVTMNGDATIDNTGLLTIEDDAITTVKILDANVTNAKIADNAVNVAKIGTLGAADANSVLTTDGVGDPQWENRTNFASSTLSNGDIFVGDATNNAAGVTMSGDATIDNTGLLTIENDAITTVKILDANVTTDKIADGDVTPIKIEPSPSLTDGDVLTTVSGAVVWQAPAVVAMGKVNAGTVVKANGASVSTNGTGDYTVTFDTPRFDSDYIVQLTLLNAGPDVTIEVSGTPTAAAFTVQISQLSEQDAAGALNSTAIDAQWYFTVTDF